MARHPILCLTCLVALVCPSQLHAQPFSQLVVFGDSLSDVGNANDALGVAGAGYFNGRFSNGPLWVEYLAGELLLTQPVANRLDPVAGRNYAFGGAWTDGSGFIQFFVTDIDEQVPDYLNNDGGPDGDELIIIWGGANDFFDDIQTNPITPVNSLTDDINSLYNAGARNFMVVNLPLLGQVPDFLGTPDEAPLDAVSSQFNDLLDTSLNNLESNLTGSNFFRVDAEALIQSAITTPAAFGFTNVTTPALGLTGINPDEYLFWDGKHPTTKAHELLATNAADALFDALYTLPGDLDLDGFVGLNDIDIALSNWNANVTPGNPLLGDPSGDGFVGLTDLDLILNNWNAGTPPAPGTAIPEPTSAALLLAALSLAFTKRPLSV